MIKLKYIEQHYNIKEPDMKSNNKTLKLIIACLSVVCVSSLISFSVVASAAKANKEEAERVYKMYEMTVDLGLKIKAVNEKLISERNIKTASNSNHNAVTEILTSEVKK